MAERKARPARVGWCGYTRFSSGVSAYVRNTKDFGEHRILLRGMEGMEGFRSVVPEGKASGRFFWVHDVGTTMWWDTWLGGCYL